MPDVIRYTEGGREFAVFGLEAKAESVRAAARAVFDVLGAWTAAGTTALEDWRGPHSATMVELHTAAVDELVGLYSDLSMTAMRLGSFPHGFTPSSTIGSAFTSARESATLAAPTPSGAVGAVPADLRSFADTVRGSADTFPSRAGTVSYDGLRAEMTSTRPLTPEEMNGLADLGATDLAGHSYTLTEGYPVEELITLTAPTERAAAARSQAAWVAEFTEAVADAIADADTTRLDLLAAHPTVAAFLVPGGVPDVLAGDDAIAVIGAYWSQAASSGDDDGDFVSRDDLEAMVDDESLPAELRAAAQYLLDNPTLYALVDTGADEGGPRFADGHISRDDLDQFLEAQAHLRVLEGWTEEIDVARHGGDPDGYISRNDLEAAADDESLPAEVRAAARYLLDHDAAFLAVADQEEMGQLGDDPTYAGYAGDGFTVDDLYGRLVNGQAYVHDPDAARDFVARLPVADDGGQGVPVWVSSDDGVQALAGAALYATDGDLTEAQAVISHLPESRGGVRNHLITAYYDMLAQRVDGVMADQWGVDPGDPTAAGHGGANWLVYAPWASAAVRSTIDGSFSAWGMGPTWDQRQAAADGNQWIFDDITGRFATFVELYEQNGGRPSQAQVDRFFAENFGEGDAEIRSGFEAYVAAMDEPDPARRQTLMFQGNTLVATHEQAGAHPYLDTLTDIPGPDHWATEFIDLRMGPYELEANEDIDIDPHESNLVVGQDILSLDPAGVDFSPDTDRPDIGGWGDDFDTSTHDWYDSHGSEPEWNWETGEVTFVDPDATLDGTRAGDWATYNDRMWFIHRMFEYTHTDPGVYDTSWVYEDAGTDVSFLPDEVQPWVERP